MTRLLAALLLALGLVGAWPGESGIPAKVLPALPGTQPGLLPGKPGIQVSNIPESLIDVICGWETRGEPNPRDAIGAAGEYGLCQIKLDSARAAAPEWTGGNQALINELFDNPRAWAHRIAENCWERGRRTAFEIARCYNGGPRVSRRNARAREYARQIAADHAELMRRKQWEER